MTKTAIRAGVGGDGDVSMVLHVHIYETKCKRSTVTEAYKLLCNIFGFNATQRLLKL